MILKEREIVQVDIDEVKKLFQWLNRVVNEKLIQAGRDLNKGTDWSDMAFDISQYIKEVTSIISDKICAKPLTIEEMEKMLGVDKKTDYDYIFYPVKDDVITPPSPKPRKEITDSNKEEKKDSPIGNLVEFIRGRSEPIGTAGRAWATLSTRWYSFFRDCGYKYVACPNNNYWWVVADSVTTKRGKELYVLMTSREEKEKLWCLAAPSDVEVVQ